MSTGYRHTETANESHDTASEWRKLNPHMNQISRILVAIHVGIDAHVLDAMQTSVLLFP